MWQLISLIKPKQARMIPVHLDPSKLRIGLAGRAELTVRRLIWLHNLGGKPQVFSDAPSEELQRLAGADLIDRLPNHEDLLALDALWVADLSEVESEALGAAARAKKVLLNTEDVLPLCDFHTPSVVRRGRLVLSAGTGGASPAAASFVRERLTAAFPETWAVVLDELAQARQAQKQAGASMADMRRAAFATLEDQFGKSDAICVNFACGKSRG
jgi:precorrin-2 dehydrogenase / sirohydrochlorin ferrochelatase